MLDFGFSEILLTSAIALVVLGPERLPKVARQMGNWMGRARLMARQLSEQLEREVNAEELLREQMKTPLRPDPPSLMAPVSEPAAAPLDDAAAQAEPAPAPAAAPPPLPDGHATTPAAMHPPTPATATTADPHPGNQ
ncbi:MAG TPA: Sec-independent protein translocase protein TatB [Steroidobacteraceae bacterium]|nr:Sec-independent protein translocase protein TatB [Steroidobacteraceae bacterium]